MVYNKLLRDCKEFLWTRKYVKGEFKKIKKDSYQNIVKLYPLSKDQKQDIDEFYLSNLGEKIPYDWHRYYAAHSGSFTPQYFPDLLLRPFFEHFMNYEVHYALVFEDKNILPYIAKAANVKVPNRIISKTHGIIRDKDNNVITESEAVYLLADYGDVFCKPTKNTYGGRGCFKSSFEKGVDIKSNSNIRQILDVLGEEYVIQDVLKCHDSIASLYPKAVNTFRVITYRWKSEFICMPVFMRIGQGGSVVDNGAAGGMFVGVKADGTLTDKAVMPYNTCILTHPDTGVAFKGHKIEGFTKVVDSALKMHRMIPEIGLVYWDFTINENTEPVLIECNIIKGTIYAIEMTHGISPFGERTAEVVQWIRKMRNTPVAKRKNYAFGNL